MDLKQSSVYPNSRGADVGQIQQAIDTLLNFAPLTELTTALEDPSFDEENKKEFRGVIAQRYLAQENFSEAKKFMAPEDFQRVAAKLESLTLAAAGPPRDKAEEMVRLGDAWAEARGRLLRAPLDTDVRMLKRHDRLDFLARRANGRSIRLKNVDAELAERDELRHASRWWLSAARARPGTPLGAQARWKALEAMPKIAAASEYAEQLAREIKGEAVSKEIYDRLRAEAPESVEAKRLAAYWSFPPAPDPAQQEFDYSARRDANILGYPYDDFGAFPREDSENADPLANDMMNRIALLPEKALAASPAIMAAEVHELDTWIRKNITEIDDAITVNFLDDLAHFFGERNITREMQQIYVPIRFSVLESNGFGTSNSSKKKDPEIVAEIEAALRNPVMQAVADYLEFSLIGLKSGDRTKIETDIPDAKEDNGKATYTSRDHAGMEKMARDFLTKYPQSRKRKPPCSSSPVRPGAPRAPTSTVVGAAGNVARRFESSETVQRKPSSQTRLVRSIILSRFSKRRYAADLRNLARDSWMHDWARPST